MTTNIYKRSSQDATGSELQGEDESVKLGSRLTHYRKLKFHEINANSKNLRKFKSRS